MMETRREFLKLGGLAAASAVTGCAAGGQGDRWSHQEIEIIRTTAGRYDCRGWAAWRGRRQIAAWLPDVRGPALSITKSIATLAASRAVGEDWLTASEHVADTIPEWRDDPWKSGITVGMLLQQVSGLEAGVIPLYRNHPTDKGRAAVALRCVDTPGSVFRYGPGHWEVLAELMKRKLASRHQQVASFMHRAVMNPIGLSSVNWRSDGQGTPYFSTGTELSVNELGRLGKTIGLLLTGIDSNGIPAGLFREMARTSAVNPMFGGGLWRNTRAPSGNTIEVEKSIDSPVPASFWNNACLSRQQPAEMVALIGSGGRRVYIWPRKDMRIARLGSSSAWSDVAFLAGF